MRILPGLSLLIFSLASSLVSGTANAHSFGQSYTLPVPFWMYGWASVAALVVSFLIAAIFMRRATTDKPSASKVLLQTSAIKWLLLVGQAVTVLLLALAIATGLFGHPNAYANLNMTLFWIIFVLGFAYFSAAFGGLYAALNPWRSISLLLGKAFRPFANGLFNYNTTRYGYWPAMLLYMAFIWVELFGGTKPLSLSYYLIAYSGINVLGSLLWGAKNWFHFGELFSVFLRMISLVSPLYIRRNKMEQWQLKCRWPLAGLLSHRADHNSLVLFILFMLSSTAYDGLHETVPWLRLFWSNILPTLAPEVANNGLRAIITHRSWYITYQWSGLFLSPFLYLGLYWIALWLGRKLAGSQVTMSALSLRFAFSLLPIAFVYHLTHYYTLLMTQGIKIIPLLSDPFGLNWNLLGTADWFKYNIIPDVSTVWHVQVVTIVIGHILSVYIAHIEALRLFGDHRKATLSQLPMLALMMIFTTAGLWILAQPIQTGL